MRVQVYILINSYILNCPFKRKPCVQKNWKVGAFGSFYSFWFANWWRHTRSCLRQLRIYGTPGSFWPCLPGWRLLWLVAPTTLSTWITAIGTIEAPLDDFAYLDDKTLTRLAPSSAFYLDNGYWHIGGTNLLGNSSSLSVLGTQKNLVIYFI